LSKMARLMRILLLVSLFIAINVSGKSIQSLASDDDDSNDDSDGQPKRDYTKQYLTAAILINGLAFLIGSTVIMSYLGVTGTMADKKVVDLEGWLPALRGKVEELNSRLIELEAEKMAYTMRNREYKQIRSDNHARIMKVIESMDNEAKNIPTQDVSISVQNHRRFRGNIKDAKRRAELERRRFQELLNKTATDVDISKGVHKNRALDRAKNLEDQKKIEQANKLSRIRRMMLSYVKSRSKHGSRDIERGMSSKNDGEDQQDENYSKRPADIDDQSSNPERTNTDNVSQSKKTSGSSKRPAETDEQASNMKRLQVYDARPNKEAKLVKGNNVDSAED